MKRWTAGFLVMGLVGAANAQTAPVRRQAKPAAKSSSKPVAPVAAPAPVTPPAPVAPPKPQFLQIRYFAEILGSSVTKWDDNQIAVDAPGTRKAYKATDPANIFNQFSFRFLTGENTRFYAEPRFTVQFGDRNDMGATEDRQVIQANDFRIGFMNNPYWVSSNKMWNTAYRIGTRLPTDRASKNSNIVLQPEALHITNLVLSPQLSFGLWNQVRYYWYEEQVDQERWRLYTGPSMTYTLNDIWSIFIMYENEIQHNAPEGTRKYTYAKESLQDVYAGVNYNVNQSLTLYPFIRFAQVSRWDPETMQIGAWIMAALY